MGLGEIGNFGVTLITQIEYSETVSLFLKQEKNKKSNGCLKLSKT